MTLKDKKILIVGLGLIGGSYAQGLKRAGFEVGAVTRSQKTVDYALENGIIDSGTTEVTPDYVTSWSSPSIRTSSSTGWTAGRTASSPAPC